MASSLSSVANESSAEAAGIALWLWPNLLSLDAPVIAVLWQNLFAHDAGVRLTFASTAALLFSVWLIYLADRLLDTVDKSSPQVTARHTFYIEHRSACYLLAVLAAGGCVVSIAQLPLPVFKNGLAVGALVMIYLAVIHGMRGKARRWLPKEIVVGLVFSIGSALSPMTWSLHPLRLVFPALLFGILCWTNSAAIETWEGGRVDAASNWMVRHLNKVAIAIALLCAVQDVFMPAEHSWMALLIGSLGYWAVASMQPGWGPNLRRVSIDAPLLAPLLLLGLR